MIESHEFESMPEKVDAFFFIFFLLWYAKLSVLGNLVKLTSGYFRPLIATTMVVYISDNVSNEYVHTHTMHANMSQ